MLGKDHFIISLAWAFLLLSPVIVQYPEFSFAFLLGIAIGAVYPDIDSTYNPYLGRLRSSSAEGNGPLTWVIALAAYPVKHLTGFVFSGGDKKKKTEYLKHRNLIHSIPGIFFSLLVILIPLNIILYLIGYWTPFVLIASTGVLVGACMHLMEDCCTLSGVKFFYPASKNVLLRGRIRVKTGSTIAGVIFTIIFAIPALLCLAYNLWLKNSYHLGKFAFLDGLSPGVKVAIAVVVSILLWLLCILISQSKLWNSGEKEYAASGYRGNSRRYYKR